MHKHWANINNTDELVNDMCNNVSIMFNADEMKAIRSDITDIVQRAYELGQQNPRRGQRTKGG